MTPCPYCRAAVVDLANHYAGYKVDPCPEVAGAFGPDTPRNRSAEAELPPDAYLRSSLAHRCSAPHCVEPVYKAGRCWEHFREVRSAWSRKYKLRARERATA